MGRLTSIPTPLTVASNQIAVNARLRPTGAQCRQEGRGTALAPHPVEGVRRFSLGVVMADKTTADLLGLLHDIPVRKGMLMPLTQFGDNSARLDWTAGLPGSLWEALTAPARAYRGEIPDEQMIPEGLNFAGNVTLGSMAATKPAGALASGAAREAEQPKGFIAYHGSPHDFDRFDMSKIGTGEGAQAYGHGLYFADSEGVAQSYRDKLGGAGGNPKKWQYIDYKTVNDLLRNPQSIADVVGAQRGMVDRARKEVEWARYPDVKANRVRDLEREQGKLAELETIANGGKMYQVRINADPDAFLDWDKPLSQQSEAVMRAYEKALTSRGGPTIEKIGDSSFGSSGSGLQNLLSAWTKHDDAGVSGALRDAGIPGIKYLDQGSRASGDGSRNYVVFDDKLIEILKKYGLLGMLGGGTLASQPTGPGILSDSMEGK